jgi:hypothetical protein
MESIQLTELQIQAAAVAEIITAQYLLLVLAVQV